MESSDSSSTSVPYIINKTSNATDAVTGEGVAYVRQIDILEDDAYDNDDQKIPLHGRKSLTDPSQISSVGADESDTDDADIQPSFNRLPKRHKRATYSTPSTSTSWVWKYFNPLLIVHYATEMSIIQ
jgi:hypothetical protein